MNKAKFVRGKQILRLQENKTLPFEEGKEEGREEDNNLVDIWYIKKWKYDNQIQVQRSKQWKAKGDVPIVVLEDDSTTSMSFDIVENFVHFTSKVKQKVSANLAKRLSLSWLVNWKALDQIFNI